MSKMGELAAQLSELKHCGEILIGISESLTELFSGDGQLEETPAEAPAAEAPPKEEAPKEKPLTLEAVRAILAEKSRSGHTAQVRALLLKHGADKLSEIAAILDRADELASWAADVKEYALQQALSGTEYPRLQ